jgi:deazaflavin-dependent oxidoreductase (nitroreductase family)
MEPVLRAGLGAWLGTPLSGWLLLIRVPGRSSGVVRSVPLSYFIAEGCIWVGAGFGRRADWFLNAVAHPRVEVVLPGRTVACLAEEVTDEATRRRLLPAYLKAVGAPALLGGVNPWHSTAAEIEEAMFDVPLVRLRPLGDPILAGPDDPGGTGWIWRQAVLTLLALAALTRARRLVR